jgi:YdjC-like protein
MAPAGNPFAAALGHGPEARLVLPHQDDVGMCHGANQAFARLAGGGFITSGSVMVPCPWFRELAELAAARPELDIGVHLTLTSEWRHYRWRPLTGASQASGLVDGDGFMWPKVKPLRERAAPDAVEAELRAQIDAALSAGIDVTHLDAHMGAAMAPEFAEIYVRLGRAYELPVLFTRSFGSYGCASTFGPVDPAPLDRRAAEMERAGLPLFDAFHETPWVPSSESTATYRRLIEGVGPGLTFLALHCNAPGDIEIIDPERAHCRTDEYALFQDERFLAWFAGLGLERIGFREIRTALRRRQAMARSAE